MTSEARRLTEELESAIAERTREVNESESRLRAILEAAADGIIVADEHGVIETFNPAAERLFGRRAATVVGQNVAALFEQPGSDVWAVGPRREATGRREDGSTFPVELTIGAMSVGVSPARVAILRDLTEKKRLEAHLRQTHTLQALGTLAGGVAHEFNNLLASIQGFSELTLDQVAPGSPEAGHLQVVLRAARRAAGLVHRVLAFSGQHRPDRERILLGPIVTEVLTPLRPSLPAHMQVREELSPSAGHVLANPTELQQVVANLCDNGLQAMRETGGILTVAVTELTIGESDPLTATLDPGRYVWLRVTDTGHGMPPEVQERVFEPFFTTRGPGEGSGLGLAVVHGIVDDLAGRVTVASRVGAGSTFDVYLPEASSPAPAPPPANAGAERRLCILLVDDEAAVLRFVQAALARLGHDAEATESGPEALARFRQSPEKYDLVISDQHMPGLTGLALAQQISAIRPGTPVVLMTGYSEQTIAEDLQAGGVSRVLHKPFTLEQLAQFVREVSSRRE